MIDAHYGPAKNGKKVTVLLEELEIPYRIPPVNLGRGDLFTAGLLAISLNSHMPAVVDTEPKGGGAPLSVFESGAILFYLAEKEGRLWPQDNVRAGYEVIQWVVSQQIANRRPKFGECSYLSQLPESAGDQSYAQRRFNDEVHRLYAVLNNRLYESRYISGEEYTSADIAAYPWTVPWPQQGMDRDEFRYVKRWFDELSARFGVQRGLAVTAGPDRGSRKPQARGAGTMPQDLVQPTCSARREAGRNR